MTAQEARKQTKEKREKLVETVIEVIEEKIEEKIQKAIEAGSYNIIQIENNHNINRDALYHLKQKYRELGYNT